MKIEFFKEFKHTDSGISLITDDLRNDVLEFESVGAIVPYIIYDGIVYDSGCLVISDIEYHIVDMDDSFNFKYNSEFILFDVFSPYADAFLKNINKTSNKILGGGVGSTSLSLKEYIFTQEGCSSDKAIIIPFKEDLKIGTKHGFKPISGPFVVTRSDKNILFELNFKPAFEVYQEALEGLGIIVNEENIFDKTPKYSFGISTIVNDECMIRNPIKINGDYSINIVGNIEEMDNIYIVSPDIENMNNSIIDLRDEIYDIDNSENLLVCESMSRIEMFNSKNRDLDILKKKFSNIWGVGVIGEITNRGFYQIKLFNKTILIGAY
jgi:hypothetical protein